MTSSALLQFGFFEEVKNFIEWFTPFIPDSGAVPCVIDKQGIDSTPEHDSHGQFLFLVTEYYRYTKDERLLESLLPQLLSIAEHIEQLRRRSMSSATPTHLRGLLPKSISHEGYAANPAYSYWDNLWALRGLEGLATAAAGISASTTAERCSDLYSSFRSDMLGSIEASMEHHDIEFLPGAADLGDFDASSTTIGADPCSLLIKEFRPAFEATFQRYWKFFQNRLENFEGSERYTPYELRIVGSLVRLGERERALEALEFFMQHRRPLGWNHWAEVVYADPREPGFVGDAPHGWVASDFLRSVGTMIAFESEGTWIIGGGIPLEYWEKGVCCELHTPQGMLSVRSALGEDGSPCFEVKGATEIKYELAPHLLDQEKFQK
jgi:hypothetical protein